MGGSQAGLSLPVTLEPLKRRSIWHLTSRRLIISLTIVSLLIFFLFTSIRPISSSVENEEPEYQDQKTVAWSPTPDRGLSELGLEADQSYHLGTIDAEQYKRELEKFIVSAFPPQSINEALQKLRLYLAPHKDHFPKMYPLIPKKIWQTAKGDNPNTYEDWQTQEGFKYEFMSDEQADKWVKDKFSGTKIAWTWDNLHVGILVRSSLVPLHGLHIRLQNGFFLGDDI